MTLLEALQWFVTVLALILLGFVVRQVYMRERQQAKHQTQWHDLYLDTLLINTYFGEANELSGRVEPLQLQSDMKIAAVLLSQLNLALRYWLGRSSMTAHERESIESWLDWSLFSWVREDEQLVQDLNNILALPDSYPEAFTQWLVSRPNFPKTPLNS